MLRSFIALIVILIVVAYVHSAKACAIGVIGASNDGHQDLDGYVANVPRFGAARTVDAINAELLSLGVECLARSVAIPGESSFSFVRQYDAISPYVDMVLIGQTGEIYGSAEPIIANVRVVIARAMSDGIEPMLSLYPVGVINNAPPPDAVATYNAWAKNTGFALMDWPRYTTTDGLHADALTLKLAAKSLVVAMARRGFL